MNHPSAGRSFSDPGRSFANLEAALVATMVTASTDVALLLDKTGTVIDVAIREPDLFDDAQKRWIGEKFVDIVTVESRQKVQRLLTERSGEDAPARREINHPMPDGPDLPISYSVLSLSKDGSRLALGRDLRTMAVLQQKLVETQLALETDYARLRNAEAQYRVLFDTASEPIVIVDAGSRKVVEANTAARALFEIDGRRVVGQSAAALVAVSDLRDIDALFTAARKSGEAESGELMLSDGDGPVPVSVRFYRQHGAGRMSVRFLTGAGNGLAANAADLIGRAGHESPDAMVVVDPDFTITAVNESFLDLTEIATRNQAVGRSLAEMIGRRGVELGVLKTAIDSDGFVRNFSTVLNTQYGGTTEVDVSGSALDQNEKRFYGFSIRRSARLTVHPGPSEPFRSANDMTGLVGRVPLREIVRETADIIEQLCIEAALELTRNNRASAAEMLGLSRQSLYSKLRRYNIGDPGQDDSPA
ncbi:transcriptional regulator PpsR [Aurantimonas sp. VKM B-3413]|uniref:transcriptional regulator PpsR n=1 Tax=Aurantimonas sp. VKM B-3413 TaxID=2779401 RepID=UPI001E3B394E|nr:transcriptional regulator PpsR [Aurantimonas sp. VKM B-3413]MCB8839078.1 transcriptional regulator PpsR [Aurantimonas sp. VKM B-3413]